MIVDYQVGAITQHQPYHALGSLLNWLSGRVVAAFVWRSIQTAIMRDIIPAESDAFPWRFPVNFSDIQTKTIQTPSVREIK